jgi:hypothetical protein
VVAIARTRLDELAIGYSLRRAHLPLGRSSRPVSPWRRWRLPHVLAQWAGDAHFRDDVGDGAALAACDETAATFDGQWRVTVKHGRVFCLVDELVVLLILPGKDLSA